MMATILFDYTKKNNVQRYNTGIIYYALYDMQRLYFKYRKLGQGIEL